MIYVAGCQQPTIVGMTSFGRGDFDYVLVREGDGRVPHALGLLPRRPEPTTSTRCTRPPRQRARSAGLDACWSPASTQRCSLTRPSRGARRGAPSLRDTSRHGRVLWTSSTGIVNEAAPRARHPDCARCRMRTPRSREDALLRASLAPGEPPMESRSGKVKPKGARAVAQVH